MIRTVFAVASAVAVVLGVSVAVAQQDVIKERKDMMKHNGAAAKVVGDMAKGDKPFDLAAAQKIFATFEDAAAKMPDLFPASSKDETGASADKFSPTPKIWEDMADFKARFAEIRRRRQGGEASVKDVASLQGSARQYRQERLRRLPQDLSGREEGLSPHPIVVCLRRGVREGAPFSSFRVTAADGRLSAWAAAAHKLQQSRDAVERWMRRREEK